MNRFAIVMVIMASTVAFAAETPKSTAPALSDAEKLQLREFELKDSQLANQLGQVQQQMKQNAEAFSQWAKGKCDAKDGKQYQIDMSAAACVEQPAKK